MRRHFFYVLLLTFTAAAANASDIRQKTQPDWPSSYSVTGSVNTVPAAASTCSLSISSTVALLSVQIVPPNPTRKGLILYNNSSNSVYIAYDTVANSSTHMTFLIPTFSSWVMPYPLWLGAIAGIRNAGTGTVLITEMQ